MIKRYNVGYLGLEGSDKGRYVKHGDYLEIVKKLEDRVKELEGQLPIISKSEFDEWWDKNIGDRKNWG